MASGLTVVLFPLSSHGAGEATTWSGKWSTNFGELTLTQSGTKVTGAHPYRPGLNLAGRVTGTVAGNRVTGTWVSDPAPGTEEERERNPDLYRGRFEWTMSADGKSFGGEWVSADNRNSGRWSGTCTGGPCASAPKAEDVPPFRFNARSAHSVNIRTPLGDSEGPWVSGALGSRNSSSRPLVVATYTDEGTGRNTSARFKIVDTQLRRSGPATVLKLDVAFESQSKTFMQNLPRCPEGARGSFVLIDDDRLLPGGERKRRQTRDQVLVNRTALRVPVPHTRTRTASVTSRSSAGARAVRLHRSRSAPKPLLRLPATAR